MAKDKEKKNPYAELGRAPDNPKSEEKTALEGESIAVQTEAEPPTEEPPVSPELPWRYKPRADPLDVQILELLERIRDGRLMYPSVYTVYDQTDAVILELRKRVCA